MCQISTMQGNQGKTFQLTEHHPTIITTGDLTTPMAHKKNDIR